MATEVSFAKTFLAILDKQPQKLTPDHVEDPRNYPPTNPYTLPRLQSSKPMSKPSTSSSKSSSSPAADAPVKVTVKSPRNPHLELTLPSRFSASTTSMLDIKNAIYDQTCLPVEKIKILYNKKPVADTKTLRDVQEGGGDVEFGIMVMGGAATAAAAAEALAKRGDKKREAEVEEMEVDTPAPVVAEGSGLSGAAVLETEEFWADLKGFLQQRIRDEKVAEEVCGKFRGLV